MEQEKHIWGRWFTSEGPTLEINGITLQTIIYTGSTSQVLLPPQGLGSFTICHAENRVVPYVWQDTNLEGEN